MTRYYGPCLCGATDCPSCGPAQGYEVVKRWNSKLRAFEFVNPEEGEGELGDIRDSSFDEPPEREVFDDPVGVYRR